MGEKIRTGTEKRFFLTERINFSIPISNFQFPISNFQFPISNLFLFLTILFLLTESITPQIIIKERVEVLPQSSNYLSNNPTESHTITAVVEWDTTGGAHNFLRARMNMINQCTGETLHSDYDYDGYIELSMSSTDAVRYEINSFTEIRDYPDNLTWYPFLFGHSLKVYADVVLIDEDPAFHNSGSSTIYYWRSNLKIIIASYSWNNYEYALCFGEKAIIDVWDEEDCQPALWNAAENIQVNIVEGGEHTSFYYEENQLIGDNVTFLTDVHGNYYSSYGNIELKYDVEYTNTSTDKLVILEAVVNGITARDTIIIPKPEGYFMNGEIEDGKERIVKWERLRINSWIEKGGMCEGITTPPEGTTFEAEIIQGTEFGGLIDTTTGEATQMLTGLTADENNIVRVEYFANGDSALTDEEIIVRINSTIAAVEPLDISFFASRSEIVVTTSPGELQAGEISDVFVYWYDEMDSLVLIPSDISLKVEVIEGAGLGDIYDPATGQYADYFDEIYQGFKFKAAEGIDTSNAQLLIKVSGIVGGGITSPQNQGGKTEEKTISNKDGKEVKGREPNFSFMEIYGIGSVVLMKDDNWCDSLIICNSNEYLPNIILNQVSNGYSGFDICTPNIGQIEGVNTFWIDTLYTFELSLCYNDQNQKLWFNITDNHTLKINYSYAICEDNIPNGCQFIDDWTGILAQLECDEFEAILHATYLYGNHATPCYYFRNIIYAHEMEHIKDYQEAIDLAKISFYEGLDSIDVKCEDFENPDFARNFWQSSLETRFNQLRRRSLEEFIEIQNQGAIRSSNETGIENYEQDAQNRHSVRAIINSQIDAVNVAYGCSIIHLYE